MTRVLVLKGSIIKARREMKGGKTYDYYALYPHGDDQEKLKQLYGKVREVDIIVIAEDGKEGGSEGA